MSPRPIVLPPGDRPRPLHVLDAQITVLASVDQTGGYEVCFDTGPEGAGPPPHAHDWDETIYVLRGELALVLDGEVRTVGAGATVHLPGGTRHEFSMGPGGADLLSITSGPGATAMFAAMDHGPAEDGASGA